MQKRTYRKVTVGETAADPSQPPPCPGAAALAVPETGMQGLRAGCGQGRPGYSPSTVAWSARAATPLTQGGRRALGTRVPTGKGPSLATEQEGDGEGCPLMPTVSHPPPCLSGEAVSVTTSNWPLAGRSGPGLGNGLWAKATD